jgi:hypothetical protein
LALEQLLPALLNNNILKFAHDKLFKDIENSSILKSKQIYSLQATENKRKLIYKDNKLIGTLPFKIHFSELIDPQDIGTTGASQDT